MSYFLRGQQGNTKPNLLKHRLEIMTSQDVDLPLIEVLDKAIALQNSAREVCGDATASVMNEDFGRLQGLVRDALSIHPDFCNTKNVFFGTKQVIFDPNWQSRQILLFALSNDSQKAAHWYRKVFNTNKAEVIYFAEIYGIKIEEPVELSPGLTLRPLPLMEDTPRISAMKRDYQYAQFSFRPTADIVTILSFSSVYDELPMARFEASKFAAHEEVGAVFRRTIGAFTLVGAAPGVVRWWAEFADSDLQAAENGFSTSGAIDDSANNAFFFSQITKKQCADVTRVLNSSSQVKDYLDLPLQRLNFAMRKLNTADKSIELGICFEALLGNDLTTEINYRISLRVALYLENSKQERLKLRSLVKKIYDLRSKTVHGSRYSKKPDGRVQAQLVKEGIDVCARIAWAIVDQQKLPDFDEIELGIREGSEAVVDKVSQNESMNNRERSEFTEPSRLKPMPFVWLMMTFNKFARRQKKP